MNHDEIEDMEDVFYIAYKEDATQSGLPIAWWRSVQLPIAPCFGEINCKILPKLKVFSPCSVNSEMTENANYLDPSDPRGRA